MLFITLCAHILNLSKIYIRQHYLLITTKHTVLSSMFSSRSYEKNGVTFLYTKPAQMRTQTV